MKQDLPVRKNADRASRAQREKHVPQKCIEHWESELADPDTGFDL
jgi:hypothetical protein